MTRLTGFILLMLLALTGCLPQAKQQSCGSGSVFNSSSRECVPITSGGTTNGVSITARSPAVTSLSVARTQSIASQFTVTVNDSLNQGYLIRWLLYPPTGATFNGNPLLINSASYNLFPNSAKAGGLDVGVWTLSAEIMNSSGVTLLTSAQWVINVTSDPTPTLSYHTGAPTSSRLTTDAVSTFVTGVMVNDTAFTATNWRLSWYYDGQLMKSGSSSGCKAPVATPGCAFNSSTTHTSFTTSNLLAVDDPPIQVVGPHTIRAELTNTAGTSVFDSKEWTVYVYAPNMPQVTATSGPVIGIVSTAIDGITIANGGFRVNGASLYDPANGAGAFCVTINNSAGSGSGVALQFKRDNGIDIGARVFAPPPAIPRICLDDIPLVASTLTFNLTNSNIGELRTIQAFLVDLGTNNTVASGGWTISVRPKNTAPVANNPGPIPSNLVIANPLPFNPGGSFVVQLQDVPQTYSFTATDDDTTSSDNMSIAYFIDGVALDGTNNYPGTTVVTPDCTHAAGVGPTGTLRMQCPIAIPSYNTTGRVDPRSRTYTITARATDMSVNGVAPLISNTLSWTAITVNPNSPAITQTDPAVANDLAGNVCTPTTPTDVLCPSLGNSYVSTLAAPLVKIVSATEGDDVIFNVLVRDNQRDDFRIGLIRLESGTCAAPGSFQVVTPSYLVTRSDDSFGHRVSIQHSIPQNTVVGAASAAVTYCVTVTDQLPDFNSDAVQNQGNAITQTITLNVNNNNPFPVWTGPVAPALAAVIDVMTGMPLTLDPGVITDASTSDGTTPTYQWEISTDAGATWFEIVGSTQRVLTWTPPAALAGLPLQIRLCMGDNGTGNDVSLCVGDAAAPAFRVVGPWTGVEGKTNTVTKNALTPTANGEVATWYDATEREMFMVYINKNGVNADSIVVEKYDVALDGTISAAAAQTLQFPSEDPDIAVAYDASRLSVVGQTITTGAPAKTYRGLYISYVTQFSPSIAPALRVRHVDLTDDLMLFDYDGVVYETDNTTDNITVASPAANTVEVTVASAVFDAGETVIINGVPLTPIDFASAPAAACEFETESALATPHTVDQVASNIENAFLTCTDERVFAAAGSTAANVWTISNFPEDFVDINYSLYLGKAGDIMLHGTTLVIPYLDNVNSGKLSVAMVQTTTGAGAFLSGALGNIDNPDRSQLPVHSQVAASVQSLELANSYGNSGTFDVALTTTANGLNAHRLTFTAPSTITLTNSVLNVFGTGVFVEKPRIATGPSATNNHVFILAQDAISVANELNFARISAATYTIPSGLPMIPLDGVHEQTMELTDYRIRALAGNKRAALAVRTDDGVNRDMLVSLIKPIVPSSDIAMVRPVGDSGLDYPKIQSALPAAFPSIGLSPSFNFTVGNIGSLASDNNTESVVVLYPTVVAPGLSASFINVAEEAISATEVDAAVPSKFQPPYVK